MARPTNKVTIERWNVSAPRTANTQDGREIVTKVVVRGERGRFHGATNFRGTVIK